MCIMLAMGKIMKRRIKHCGFLELFMGRMLSKNKVQWLDLPSHLSMAQHNDFDKFRNRTKHQQAKPKFFDPS